MSRVSELDEEVADDRYLDAMEEIEIEEALRRGEARECPGCGQIVAIGEPCCE